MKRAEKIIIKNIDDLVPYAKNSRTHTAQQILKIRASLREFGFTNPVLIDTRGNIIAGHGRVQAARDEGINEIPCILIDYMTEAQRRAYVIADNRIALDGEWDQEMLALEIGELKSEFGFDIALAGIEDDELSKIMSGEDAFDASAFIEKLEDGAEEKESSATRKCPKCGFLW